MLDDLARKFLISQKNFEEDHSLMNVRLIISTITVAFSLYGIAHDWLNPFPASKPVLIFCVAAYFISLAFLTSYTQFVEKTCFGAAKQKSDSINGKSNTWKFSSKRDPKVDDFYSLEIELIDGNTSGSKKQTFDGSVTRYFDDNGKLCCKKFYTDLSKYCNAMLDDKKSK